MICHAQPLADRRAPTQMKYFPPTHHGLLSAQEQPFSYQKSSSARAEELEMPSPPHERKVAKTQTSRISALASAAPMTPCPATWRRFLCTGFAPTMLMKD